MMQQHERLPVIALIIPRKYVYYLLSNEQFVLLFDLYEIMCLIESSLILASDFVCVHVVISWT